MQEFPKLPDDAVAGILVIERQDGTVAVAGNQADPIKNIGLLAFALARLLTPEKSNIVRYPTIG
jgi:hypothetical protein